MHRSKPRRKNPRVSRPRDVLYHGTSGAALPKIKAKGILPRATHAEWISPHSTVTTTATFLVDDIVIAFFYAAGMHRFRPEARIEHASTTPTILEVDVAKVRRHLHPDYDDAQRYITDDLSELFRFTGKKFKVGQRLTARQAEMVEEALIDMQDEHQMPMFLSVTYTPAGVPYLTAEPWVGFGIEGEDSEDLLAETSEITWVDGTPLLFARQYLVQGPIPRSAIVGAWQECHPDEADRRVENLGQIKDGEFEWIYLRRLPW